LILSSVFSIKEKMIQTGLIALLPPSNISRIIQVMKDHLFKKLNYCSSKALPPLIPLQFTTPVLKEEEFINLAAPFIAANTVQSTEIKFFRNCIYFDVQFKRDINQIMQAFKEKCSYLSGNNIDKINSLFPVYTGILLSANEGNLEKQDIINVLPPAEKFSFTAYHIAYFFIETESGLPFWWHNFYYEVPYVKKNKKRT
jgi:hypothetical protein